MTRRTLLQTLVEHANRVIPLHIAASSWDGLQLHLSGSGWSFNSMSPWRLTDGAAMIVGCGDDAAAEAIAALAGIDVVQVEILQLRPALDPMLRLANGMQLSVFSATSMEPWIFNLPNGLFVASPTDASLTAELPE
jgi:hypothetical protein